MKARGNGMLRLSIYVGVLVWNKVHYVRDPETGRRVTRPNPPSEWKRIEVPHLRIVDQDLWDAVQKRLDETGGKPGRTNRPAKRRLPVGPDKMRRLRFRHGRERNEQRTTSRLLFALSRKRLV